MHARSDSSRRPPRDADRRDALRAELADHLQVQDAASLPGRHDPPHRVVARQHGQQQAQPRSDGVGRLGQPDDGRDGPWLDGHRVPDRRAVSGGTGEAPRAASRRRPPASGRIAEARMRRPRLRPTVQHRPRHASGRVAGFCCWRRRRSPRSAATTNGEWRAWGGDLGVTRYAPLDQINAANFNKLEVAWRFKTDNLGKRPDFNLQTDAADGQRRALRHRRRASQRRRHQRRHRRAALDAPARGRPARRGVGAPPVGTRRRLLDRRQGRRADLLRHDRLSARRPRREDRPSAHGLRHQRRRRSEDRTPIRSSIRSPARSPGTARRSSPGTSSSSAPRIARARRRAARRTRRATSAATTRAPASGSGSSTRFRGPASSATTRGWRTRGPTPATPACGRR